MSKINKTKLYIIVSILVTLIALALHFSGNLSTVVFCILSLATFIIMATAIGFSWLFLTYFKNKTGG